MEKFKNPELEEIKDTELHDKITAMGETIRIILEEQLLIYTKGKVNTEQITKGITERIESYTDQLEKFKE